MVEDLVREFIQFAAQVFQRVGLAVDDGFQQARENNRRIWRAGLVRLGRKVVENQTRGKADGDQAIRRQNKAAGAG